MFILGWRGPWKELQRLNHRPDWDIWDVGSVMNNEVPM